MSGNNGHSQPKTIYIPYMCDHGYILAAGLEAFGLPTEVLPPPDEETLALGLDLCRGRECSPCFTTTGDIIRRARQPGFDPKQTMLLMPSAGGLCRFGQYVVFQGQILEDLGLGDIEIISPSCDNAYHGFGDNPTQLRKLVWEGVVAVDVLQKLVHEHRPYELNPGQTDRIYRECLDVVIEAIKAGGGKRSVVAMKKVAKRFEALPVDRSDRRPLIGLVGEIYLRFNEYSNQDIVRKVESLGGEVMVASMMEWFYYSNWNFRVRARVMNQYKDIFTSLLSDLFQHYQERRLVKPVEHLLRTPHEASIAEIMHNLQPHYDPAMGLESEAGPALGKAVDFARQGVCGILNIMPFSCMPGIVVAGMAPRFRADWNDIPWLDVIYDAQAGTNVNTRLEAFMYQAVQFQRRMAREVPA